MAIGEPTYKKQQTQGYYVHGIHNAKTPGLSGGYWTKPEALKAAQRLANEENETVTISTPKGMVTVTPKSKVRFV